MGNSMVNMSVVNMSMVNMKKAAVFFFAFVMCAAFMCGVSSAADNSLQSVTERGVLRVVTAADNPPKEFHLMKDGTDEIVGFDIDIAKLIAERLGVKFEITDMKFAGIIPSIQNNEFDMAVAGFNPTEERKQIVRFSDVYHVLPFVIFTHKDKLAELPSIESLKGKEVGVQMGTTQEKILDEYIPDCNKVALGKLPEVIMEVNEGTVDAALVGWLTAQNYMVNYPNLAVAEGIKINVPEDKTGQAMVFPKGSDALAEKVNAIIADLQSDGTITQLLEKNIKLAQESGQY